MRSFTHLLLVAGVALLAGLPASTAAPSNGWNDDIEWVAVGDAAGVAKDSGKPIMTVIHKSWCGACKALKPKFAASTEIAELSKQFVMVNAMDDDEPAGDEYKPDGGYIPRILFSDSAGAVHPELHEGPNAKYAYFYSDAAQIVAVMKSALAALGGHSEL